MRVCLVVVIALAVGLGLGLTDSPPASAATSSTVTVASGSPVVIVSGLSKGDVVDVQATLSTTEPGELAESTVDGLPPEPLVLQSTGGFSFTVPVYAQPRATRFTATTDGESLSGFIQNFDHDESASVTVTVNSTAVPIFSQQTKAALAKLAVDQAVVGAGSATAGVDCLVPNPVEVCATFYDALSSVSLLSSVIQAQLALDTSGRTPDPNFTVVQEPVTHSLPDISAQDGLTQVQAAIANALLTITQSSTDVAKAAKVTADRAQSAADAADLVAQQQQVEALNEQLAAYSDLLHALADARAQLVGAFGGGGSALAAQAVSSPLDETVTQDDVFNFGADVANNGLPDPITEDLRQVGASDDEMDTIRQLAMVQDPVAAAGEYPARIGDPTLVEDLLAAAADVRADLPPAIGHLIETVKGLQLQPRGIENSLLAKLTGAQRRLDANDGAGVCAQLSSFISQVLSQRGKKIEVADARALTSEAARVRQSLGCSSA